ncbi:hypothetical protein C8Q77DRAFT_1076486 [Trametes polyzona]|nr:hypothetical protein C8Q77DRAFT_1076486 [Trametes polyzona]
MLNKILPVVVLAVLGGVLNVAAQESTFEFVIEDFNKVTTRTYEVEKMIQGLNEANFAVEGPAVIAGLQDISAIGNTFDIDTQALPTIASHSDAAFFDESNAVAVVDALKTFVQAQKGLLHALSGKHSLASQFNFISEIAAALTTFNSVATASHTALVRILPTREHESADLFRAFADIIAGTRKVYS